MIKPALRIAARTDKGDASQISHHLSRLQDLLCQRDVPDRPDTIQYGLGVQSCLRPQQIASVAFSKSALLLVISGRKELHFDNRSYMARAGDFLFVPGDSEFWLGKFPEPGTGLYLGMGIRFDIETIELFQKIYGNSLETWDLSPRWCATASEGKLEWIAQWLDWSRRHPASIQVQRHRLIELLLLLAQAGMAGNILLSRSPSWRQRAAQIISMEPARDWRIGEVCRTLGASESALRRKLKLERTSFREVLEQTRLMAGLALVQESGWSICRIADSVGYQSQSRFTDRFKLRFGVTPSELRRADSAD
jgi:AraC-like DNA-binding protein